MDLALLITTVAGTIAVPLMIALITWAVKIHATLAGMTESLKSVPELWRKSNRHERQLSRHGEHLAEIRGRLGIKNKPACDDDDEGDGP